MAVGFTPHHPNDDNSTKIKGNFAVIKISDDKYLTLTYEVLNFRDLREICYKHMLFHERSKFDFNSYKRSDKLFNSTAVFQTHFNTHTIWAHHDSGDGNDWFQRHQLKKKMDEGLRDFLAGRFPFQTRFDYLNSNSPDWNEQVMAIRGKI